MPGPDERSPFDMILEAVVSRGAAMARNALPTCNVCDGKAIPIRCLVCGEYTCVGHGFFNVGSGSAVCGLCVDAMQDELDVDSAPATGSGVGVDGFPWRVLGLTEDASSAAVKKAYRKLARQWHPDVNHEPEAEVRFRELQRAYRVALDLACD